MYKLDNIFRHELEDIINNKYKRYNPKTVENKLDFLFLKYRETGIPIKTKLSTNRVGRITILVRIDYLFSSFSYLARILDL